jgi:hypothetical protein
MTIMSLSGAPLGRVHMGDHNRSVWRNFLGAVLQPRNWNVEDEVVEYLHHHRHDLPPEVSIELERHRPNP